MAIERNRALATHYRKNTRVEIHGFNPFGRTYITYVDIDRVFRAAYPARFLKHRDWFKKLTGLIDKELKVKGLDRIGS